MNSLLYFILIFILKIYQNTAVSIEDFKISSITSLIESKNSTCADVIYYFIDRSVAYNPEIKALTTFNRDSIKRALELDEYYQVNGKLIGKLHCVPFLIKDNIDVMGIPTTAGIRALGNLVPNKNALVVDRLFNEGAIFIAKANLGELALGIKYESEIGGKCLNPFDKKRTCGESSSGSAAGISSAMAIVSLGTDTSGSIIGPASYNGLYGLRSPSNNPPIDGVLPVFEVQDTVGPLTKHIDDLVLTYSVINDNATIYENFSESISPYRPTLKIITNFLSSFKIGNFDYFIDPEIYQLVDRAASAYKNLNVNVVEQTLSTSELREIVDFAIRLEMPAIRCLKSCYRVSINKYLKNSNRFSETSPFKDFKNIFESPLLSDTWKNQSRQLQYPENVDENLFCQTECQQYNQLRAQFNILANRYFTENIDALLVPSIINNVPLLNQTGGISMGLFSVYTGMAMLTVPAGFTSPTSDSPDGLPFTMALIGRNDQLINLFKIAKLYENENNFAKLPHSTPIIQKNSVCITSPDNLIENKSNKLQFSYKISYLIYIILIFFLILL